MTPFSHGSLQHRCTSGTLKIEKLLCVAALASAFAIAGCAAHHGHDRYTSGARASFFAACVDELDHIGPQRTTVYLPLDGEWLTVPDYCTRLAHMRVRRQ